MIQRMHTGAAINQNMKLLRRNNQKVLLLDDNGIHSIGIRADDAYFVGVVHDLMV